jgi:hypothetical protein
LLFFDARWVFNLVVYMEISHDQTRNNFIWKIWANLYLHKKNIKALKYPTKFCKVLRNRPCYQKIESFDLNYYLLRRGGPWMWRFKWKFFMTKRTTILYGTTVKYFLPAIEELQCYFFGLLQHEHYNWHYFNLNK